MAGEWERAPEAATRLLAGWERRPSWTPSGPAGLILYVTGQCNLRCDYCYERLRASPRMPHMTRGVALQALQFLDRWADRGPVGIRFTGGEPLLYLELVEYVVAHAAAVLGERGQLGRMRYEVTTNGTLEPRRLAALLAAGDFRVNLSLDAPPDRHDRRRRLPDGRGSCAAVAATLEALCGAGLGGRVTINCVLQPGDDPREAWDWLRGLEVGGVRFIPALPGSSRPDPWRGADGRRLAGQLARGLYRVGQDCVAALVRGGSPPRITNLVDIWGRLAAGVRQPCYCGAGDAFLAVVPGGRIYPCHRLTGDDRFALGHVAGDGGLPPAESRFPARRPVEGRRTCRLCWARYLCGGGCCAAPALYGLPPDEPYAPLCVVTRALCAVALEGYETLIRCAPHALARLVAPEGLRAWERALDDLLAGGLPHGA